MSTLNKHSRQVVEHAIELQSQVTAALTDGRFVEHMATNRFLEARRVEALGHSRAVESWLDSLLSELKDSNRVAT